MKLSNITIGHCMVLLLSCSLFFSSCKKDEGCTDVNSENFDPTATKDDGSCVPITDKFLGTYSVEEECSTDFYSYTMSITESSSNGIAIANFGDFQQAITASVEGRFLSIPDQTVNNNSGNISITSGLGEISGNVLTITYSYTIDGSETEICSKSCTKI